MIELVAGTYIISHRLKPWPGTLSPSSPPNRVTFGDGIFVWVWHIFFPFLIPFSFFYTLQFICFLCGFLIFNNDKSDELDGL
jgi:hypothetical protein